MLSCAVAVHVQRSRIRRLRSPHLHQVQPQKDGRPSQVTRDSDGNEKKTNEQCGRIALFFFPQADHDHPLGTTVLHPLYCVVCVVRSLHGAALSLLGTVSTRTD